MSIRRLKEKFNIVEKGEFKNTQNYIPTFFSQVNDPYLDISRACLCVQTLLEKFANRQLTVTESWEKWQTTVEITRQRRIECERKIEESTRVWSLIILCFFLQ